MSEGAIPVGLLKTYPLWIGILRERLLDELIAGVTLDEAEAEEAVRKLAALHGSRDQMPMIPGLSQKDVMLAASRVARIEKLKRDRFASQVPAYFLRRKADLDHVIFSLVRTRDHHLAEELVLRIRHGEEEFSSVARTFSEGRESSTGGLLGPIPRSRLSDHLSKLLDSAEPGKLIGPSRAGEWTVLVRLERRDEARLDGAMEKRLLDELFETWLQQELRARLASANARQPMPDGQPAEEDRL